MTYPKVLVRSEESRGRIGIVESVMQADVAGPPQHEHDLDEREFARRAARKEGVEPPEWALQEIPPVTRLGPPIGEGSA